MYIYSVYRRHTVEGHELQPKYLWAFKYFFIEYSDWTCFLKQLSKSIRSAFKVIFKQTESYNKKITFFSGITFLCKILSNHTVINSIHNLNNRSKATLRSCFDFWILYRTIPHNKLIKVLFEIIRCCFKEDNEKF